MGGTKLIGIVLVVLGALGLIYGGFSYTKEETAAKIGPMEIKVAQQENVNIPLWVGIGAIVIGGALLVMGRKS
ncbi:hypothetical protein [Comamonas sp.]|mgnify:FL=1|uniref:hypothetical protein n=1 Tax=Comamonas sp. TaxID=34028 RepID=UPI00289E6690|nr:hypothetical protein [Comamonas sp.]